MHSSQLGRWGTALLLCAAVLVAMASGCTRTAPNGGGTAGTSQPANSTAEASSTPSASGSVSGAKPKSSAPSAKPEASKPLSNSDVEAIDAELSAIEKELDSMALPSDSDFGGIESGLK